MEVAVIVILLVVAAYALWGTKNQIVKSIAWLILFALVAVRGALAMAAGQPVGLGFTGAVKIPGWVVLVVGVLGTAGHLWSLVTEIGKPKQPPANGDPKASDGKGSDGTAGDAGPPPA